MNRKAIGLWALVLFLGLLGVGTISNQLRINKANAALAEQAAAGERGLNRQCQLLPVGKKIYKDALERRVITVGNYDLVVSTAETACSQP